MEAEESTSWETYEEVARYLLEKMGDTLGLGLERVEGKQKLVGKATNWTVDGKGVKTEDGAIVVIECRRYTTSKLKQKDMAALAYTIRDVGAAGGIVVTPIGVQKGGRLIAKSAGIQIVHLDADSTTTDYVLKFLGSVFIGCVGAETDGRLSRSLGHSHTAHGVERLSGHPVWNGDLRKNATGLLYRLLYINTAAHRSRAREHRCAKSSIPVQTKPSTSSRLTRSSLPSLAIRHNSTRSARSEYSEKLVAAPS